MGSNPRLFIISYIPWTGNFRLSEPQIFYLENGNIIFPFGCFRITGIAHMKSVFQSLAVRIEQKLISTNQKSGPDPVFFLQL